MSTTLKLKKNQVSNSNILRVFMTFLNTLQAYNMSKVCVLDYIFMTGK